jgi:predicted nucleic acid-binding protein
MTYVLDACALVAYIKEEDGAATVQNLIDQAVDEETMLCMSIMNLIEVCYGFAGDLGKEQAAKILNQIYDLPLQIIDTISNRVFNEAVRLKSSYAVSLADTIGLATTFDLSAAFVTSDGEIKPVDEAEPVTVFWFRPPKEKQGKKKVDVNAIIAERDHAIQRAEKAERRITELEANR